MLKVKDVSKSINHKDILHNINFSINAGEIFALVGPNGAGKTTLLNLISNLLTLNQGSISYNGYNISYKSFEDIAFMQDNSILYDNLTGYQHFKFVAKLHDKNEKKIEEIIEKLEMSDYIHRKIKKYSLGMKQHVVLGMCLICNPKLILLDEPLNGLDPSSSLKLREVLIDLKQKGTAVIFSSHILSEVDKIADKILYIKKGNIISVIDNTHENMKDNYILEVNSIKEVLTCLKENNIEIINVSESTRRIRIKINPEEFNDLIILLSNKKLNILSIEKGKNQLTEDYYYEIMGENYE